jgi:serine/threonine protein kinase
MGDPQQRVVGDWEIQHKIGSGSFATVWKARHRVTRIEAAVKEINTESLNRKLQDSLASEITVLEDTRHPNIVGLLDIIKVLARLALRSCRCHSPTAVCCLGVLFRTRTATRPTQRMHRRPFC